MIRALSIRRQAKSRPLILGFRAALLAAVCACPAQAQSGASRNSEGNRLFGDGKFPQAEKAYLEAQAALPDRPEIFYNLGNTLIRQKKYDLGLQSLRQAASQGDGDLQGRSWFNSGNALFEMGNFGDAAQAYAQALRINPSDADAKHNLELALKKAQEQPQGTKTGDNQESPQQQNQEKRQDQPPEKQPSEAPQPPSGSEERPDRNEPANPRSSRAESQEGGFSKERALQILDALQNLEFMEQRKQLERMAKRKVAGRDW